MKVLPQNYSTTPSHHFQHNSKLQFQTSKLEFPTYNRTYTHQPAVLLLFFKFLYFRIISADFCTHKIFRSLQIFFPCTQQLFRFPHMQMVEQYFQQTTATFFKIFFIQLFISPPINWIYTIWILRNLLI